MKIIIAIAICLSGIITNLDAQTDSTLKKLLLLNYSDYTGHTVDSLFRALPTDFIDITIVPGHRIDYGNELLVEYPNKVFVLIKVDQFKFMNPIINNTNPNLPPTINWKIDLFKKETIAYTMVYQDINCYAGCENDPRYYK